MGGRDHAIECEKHPGTFYSGFNGPDDCPLCVEPVPPEPLPNPPQTLLERARANNIALERIADELIAARVPGYKHLALVRERDDLRSELHRVRKSLERINQKAWQQWPADPDARVQYRRELRALIAAALDPPEESG